MLLYFFSTCVVVVPQTARCRLISLVASPINRIYFARSIPLWKINKIARFGLFKEILIAYPASYIQQLIFTRVNLMDSGAAAYYKEQR